MIPGTKQFKPKKNLPDAGTELRQNGSEVPAAAPVAELEPVTTEKKADDAPNINRRELFQSILPGIGQGLVKLLRTSNHLKDELKEKLSDTKKT